MGLFSFLRKKEKTIEVHSIGKLKYLNTKEGNFFFAYVKNERIKQVYELFVYSESFKMPNEQIEYYDEIINNWDTIAADIKTKLQKEKKIISDNLSLNIFGVNEKGKDSYDAALACSIDNLDFTVILKRFKIKEIEYNG